MALAFAHQGHLWIVLDDENIERIENHDPFDFNTAKWPVPLALKVPIEIHIAYATQAEQLTIAKMDSDQVIPFLARGYKYTDSDRKRGDKLQQIPTGSRKDPQ